MEGSEAFCPYCGISLQPIAPTAEENDESLESTIMMAPGEVAELPKKAAEETASDDLPQPAAPSILSSDLKTGSETPNEKASSGDGESAPDPLEAPIPSILSDFSRTEGNIQSPSTSEISAEEMKENLEASTDLPDESLGEAAMPEPPQTEAVETQVVEPETPAVFEETLADQPASDRTEESIDLPETPEPVSAAGEAETNQDPEPVEAAPEQTDNGPAVSVEAASSVDEGGGEPSSENIVKPDGDLSQYDSYQSQSMFDSVRIMEPSGLEKEDVATQIHPASGRFDAAPAARQTGTVDQPAAEQAISSTSHGIGVGDTDGKKSAKLKPLTEGTVLNGRYEIIRKIGGGGMGAVYLASDNNLGGVLRAVKEMIQTHIEEEQQEKAINDFKRESMILSSLDHVSIPTIYDYFYDEKESRFYLVMKYISGGDLSSRLRAAQEGKIDEKSVCEWAVQIIDVLDYLHNQPSTIVYRDLKPSNIMIDGNSGRAMLIDFGIARSISQKQEKGVTAVGTMGYAPPELFSGNVEPRSDIYSLGSTMFHLLTGADPQSNPLLIFDFQKNPRPRQINPQLSDQIERIMMKAVQYNSDQRFGSAAEMRDVLEEHLSKLKAGIVTYGVSEVPQSVSLSNQSVFCGFCGQRIVATDMFCAFCGAKQPIAQHGVHAEIYSDAAWTAKLVIEGTSELTAPAFSLQKDDNLLGRRDPMSNIFPEVDLSKYDPQTKISRRHARIWREGGNFLVEDLGSSNGTILSRSATDSFKLPPRQPQVLAAGDRIRLGDATLHFIIG